MRRTHACVALVIHRQHDAFSERRARYAGRSRNFNVQRCGVFYRRCRGGLCATFAHARGRMVGGMPGIHRRRGDSSLFRRSYQQHNAAPSWRPLRRPWQRMARRAYRRWPCQLGGSARHARRSRRIRFGIRISLRPHGARTALFYGPGNHSLRRSACRKLSVHSKRRPRDTRKRSRLHGAHRTQYHEPVFICIVLEPCVRLDSAVQHRVRLRAWRGEKHDFHRGNAPFVHSRHHCACRCRGARLDFHRRALPGIDVAHFCRIPHDAAAAFRRRRPIQHASAQHIPKRRLRLVQCAHVLLHRRRRRAQQAGRGRRFGLNFSYAVARHWHWSAHRAAR